MLRSIFVFLLAPLLSESFSIAPLFSSVATKQTVATNSDMAGGKSASAAPKRIAVTGATGRTGSLVVRELLDRGNRVVAIVRDLEKAKDTFSSLDLQSDDDVEAELSALKIIKCDLGSERDIISSIQSNGCDAAIWCATGFSDNPTQTFMEKLQGVFGVAVTPKKGIDSVGIPALAKAFEGSQSENNSGNDFSADAPPKVIMLSSAGVTRPSWDEEKKKMFEGCADIPIVRLNPFKILDIKADSEERLRQSGVPYCIFRPTGLNDKWPSGSRPIFSQGDVAVGRINRKDVATILADCITAREVTGKTFEAFTIEGYPPAESISAAVGRLRLDSEGPIPTDALSATFTAMQQLLPGEKQDAAALAMGQTYEELDSGKTGRLGERGKENAEAAAPQPSLR